MLATLGRRMLFETDWRCLAKFLYGFGVKGAAAMRQFRRRLDRGELFPPFLFVSVTSACNLRCQGCWVSVGGPRRELALDELVRVRARLVLAV